MKQNREIAIKECLKWEGGYSNDAADPGGPTNWGITIVDARKYWKANATAADVKAMPQSVAVEIYRQKYWKTPYYDCDNLASGVDLSVFDFGVNSGPARAKKYLDRVVGGTDEDTIIRLNDARLQFLQGLKTWPNFGKGWKRRVVGIKAKSLEMNKTAPAKSNASGGILAAVIAAGAAAYQWGISHPILVGSAVGALILIIGTYLYLRNKK